MASSPVQGKANSFPLVSGIGTGAKRPRSGRREESRVQTETPNPHTRKSAARTRSGARSAAKAPIARCAGATARSQAGCGRDPHANRGPSGPKGGYEGAKGAAGCQALVFMAHLHAHPIANLHARPPAFAGGRWYPHTHRHARKQIDAPGIHPAQRMGCTETLH